MTVYRGQEIPIWASRHNALFGRFLPLFGGKKSQIRTIFGN